MIFCRIELYHVYKTENTQLQTLLHVGLMGCLHDPAFIQLAGSSMVIRRTSGL